MCYKIVWAQLQNYLHVLYQNFPFLYREYPAEFKKDNSICISIQENLIILCLGLHDDVHRNES